MKLKIKQSVKPEDIKAHIYDNISFIVDLQGVSTEGLEQSDNNIAGLFDKTFYNRIEDNYTYDEISEWDKRSQRQISNLVKRRIIETEKVIRYISKDENEIITVSKYYVEIRLIYKRGHILKDKMHLLHEIIKKYIDRNEFLEVSNILLKKNNIIVCKTLPMLYRCYEKSVYGNIKNGVTYQEAVFTDYSSSSIIVMNENILNVSKEITAGMYKNNIAYMGQLNFTIAYSGKKNIMQRNIEDILTDMNTCLFDIFINHLTESFVSDLINGTSTKVLEGFHRNEK